MKRKTILKEAGVLLMTAILVLTVADTIPMKATQTSDHDVGVTAIISPTTGPMQTYPVEVTVKNFGSNDEFFPVNVVIEKNAVVDYDQTIYISINAGQFMNATFPSWYPSDLGEYQVTASTQLSGDENPSNDWLNKTIYIVIEFMGFEVAPLGQAQIAIVNGSLSVSHCVSGQNDTDGVWINLNYAYNQFDVAIQNFSLNGTRTSSSFSTVNSYGIDEEGIKEYTKLTFPCKIDIDHDYLDVGLNADWQTSRTATVEAFNYPASVFYKEHIAGEVEHGRSSLYFGYVKVKIDDTSLRFSYGNPLSVSAQVRPSAPWSWPQQGVKGLVANCFKLTPENLSQPTWISDNSLYATNIPTFEITGMYAVVNNPPSKPSVTGSTSGKIKQIYNYTVVSTDPEGNNISYLVDWGDGSNMSSYGPYSSGVQVTMSHSWAAKGTYTIRAKAMDQYCSESNWTTLTVTMPFSYEPPNHPFLSWLFERFPHAFPILRQLLGY